MIYALTEQQHAEIVDAMSVSYPTDRSKLSAHIEALAMLKGLKPVELSDKLDAERYRFLRGPSTNLYEESPAIYNDNGRMLINSDADSAIDEAIALSAAAKERT
jgi:hypothetical protein